MNTVSAILLPPRMRAELAHSLAEYLSWTPDDPDVVNFTALAIMHMSWAAYMPFTLPEMLTSLLSSGFREDANQTLARFADIDHFEEMAQAHDVSPVTLVQAQQSVLYWADKLDTADTERLQGYLDATLDAVLRDQTARSHTLADDMESAIETWHPELARDAQAVPGLLAPISPLAPSGTPPHNFILDHNGEPIGESPTPAEALESVMSQLRGRRAASLQNTMVPPVARPVLALSLNDARRSPGIAVYLQNDAISAVQKMPPSAPNEGNAQQRRLVESMASRPGWRALSLVPEGTPLQSLYHRFPHFKEVLNFIEKSLALAGCGDDGRLLSIPPILLRSKPGVGKTYFAQELARVMGAAFVERDLSVTTEAFVLSGMDAGWKNSKPGLVFNSLVDGPTANPVICLNEVDKCSAQGSHNSPMASLHALLEPTSASRFVDEFVPLPIDASRIVWILTANDGAIPDPILSRLEVFDIAEPNKAECRAVAVSVWASICSTVLPRGHGFAAVMGEPLLEVMSSLSPRVMRKALTHAASSAALEGRKYLTLEDLTASQNRYQPSARRAIGF